jgi:hemerythrin
MLLKWTSDLTVGNETIDKEHQRWVEILNDFYMGIKEGKPKEKLSELVEAMVEYTRYHFKNEEAYMKSVNFPELNDHIAKHQEYIEKITTYQSKIKEGKMILSLEVTNFLKTWLINHIKGQDQQYSNFVANR